MSQAALGSYAIPGDPNSVLTLADRFIGTAEDLATVRHKLSDGSFQGSWEGPAAAAFRETVSQLPDELSKLATAHDSAGYALRSYAHELDALQAQASVLADRLEAARADERSATAAAGHAQHRVDHARREYEAAPPEPATVSLLRDALDQHTSSLQALLRAQSAAGDHTRNLESHARELYESFEAAARRCAQRIDDACTLGVLERIGNAYEVHTPDLVKVVLEVLAAPLIGLKQIYDFFRDPSWTGLHDALDGLGAVLAVVAIALAVAGAPFTGLILAGMFVIAAAQFAAGVVVHARGEGSDEQLVGDAVGLGLAAIPLGRLVHKAGTVGSKAWVTRVLRYGESGRRVFTPTRPLTVWTGSSYVAEAYLEGRMDEARDKAYKKKLDDLWFRPATRFVPASPSGDVMPSYCTTKKTVVRSTIPLAAAAS